MNIVCKRENKLAVRRAVLQCNLYKIVARFCGKVNCIVQNLVCALFVYILNKVFYAALVVHFVYYGLVASLVGKHYSYAGG